MGKKQRQNKKNEITFQLVHRSVSDPGYQDGATPLILMPKTNRDAIRSQALTGLQDLIAQDMSQVDLFPEGHTFNENNENVEEYDEDDSQNSDTDDDNNNDDYDYSQHYRPIDENGVFVAAGGEIISSGFATKPDTTKVDIQEDTLLKPTIESKDIPEDQVDPELLAAIEAAENSDIDSDFDYIEETVDSNIINKTNTNNNNNNNDNNNDNFGSTILDQFLIDANKSDALHTFNLGDHIRNLLKNVKDDDVDSDEIDSDDDDDDINYDDDGDIDIHNLPKDYKIEEYYEYSEEDDYYSDEDENIEDNREKRDIDNYFDVVIKDYKDEQIGEGDETQGHLTQDNPVFQDILDEYIEESKAPDFFKELDQGKVDIHGNLITSTMTETQTDSSEPSLSIKDRLIQESIASPEVLVPKTDVELETELDINEEDEDFSYLDMPEPKEDDEFDAESICSTYSNTENHPTILKTKKKPKIIKLSKKTGLPLRSQDDEDDIENDDDMKEDDDENEDENTIELPDIITKRNKKESKEEKKKRKADVKEAQRIKREQKKQLKNKFKEEEQKQLKNQPVTINSIYNME